MVKTDDVGSATLNFLTVLRCLYWIDSLSLLIHLILSSVKFDEMFLWTRLEKYHLNGHLSHVVMCAVAHFRWICFSWGNFIRIIWTLGH